MRYFHASKGEVAFLAWPITPGNSVKYFATCVEYVHNLFTIPPFVLSFPMKTAVSSVHFIAAIIIRRSVFCTTKLRVVENMVLRRIFGPRRDEVTGEWRRLHNEGLNDLYSSPNIMLVI